MKTIYATDKKDLTIFVSLAREDEVAKAKAKCRDHTSKGEGYRARIDVASPNRTWMSPRVMTLAMAIGPAAMIDLALAQQDNALIEDQIAEPREAAMQVAQRAFEVIYASDAASMGILKEAILEGTEVFTVDASPTAEPVPGSIQRKLTLDELNRWQSGRFKFALCGSIEDDLMYALQSLPLPAPVASDAKAKAETTPANPSPLQPIGLIAAGAIAVIAILWAITSAGIG